MQATGQAVKPTFYISIVVIVLIMLIGLYKLLQPRFRQITMPIFDRATPTQATKTVVTTRTTNVAAQPQPAPQPVPQPVATEPVAQQPTTPEPTISTTPNVARPPRLNIPTVQRSAPVPHVPLTSAPQQKINPETEYADVRNALESAGYVFKGMPKIKGVQTASVAIGSDEVLWIGAVGVPNSDMQRAVETLSGVFSDTLEDIEIHINAFIIGAPDATTAPSNILQFATIDDFRNYITGKPNTPPDADDTENFDAYSGYIGTVMDYIGKI